MPEIELFHWNPKRPLYKHRLAKMVPIRRRVNNFGDLLGPLIVQAILREKGLSNEGKKSQLRLLSIGSVLHFSRPGDVAWGTGINGKIQESTAYSNNLDIRAVRGPLTRKFLQDRGYTVPEIYGDPGLLISKYWQPSDHYFPETDVLVVPNLNDLRNYKSTPNILNPTRPLSECINRIMSSRFVVGSSLHAIIVAESFGVPARLIKSESEPAFKYTDYYAGTGRFDVRIAESMDEALDIQGENLPDLNLLTPLLEAFPDDLWKNR